MTGPLSARLLLFAGVLLLPALALAWAPTWSDPSWPLTALGRPCAGADLSESASTQLLCSATGSVAGARMDVDMLRASLPGEHVVFERAPTGLRRPSLRITASGTRMTIRQVTCGACARVMGTAWLIDLATIRSTDLAAIQAALGLPSAPLLRDPARWPAALATLP